MGEGLMGPGRMGAGRSQSRIAPPAILSLLLATLAAVTLVLTSTGSTARACSCGSVDPVDAVAFADVVFTGTVIDNEGSDFEPSWRFEVDGVVKGEVGPIEVVTGSDWAAGCGTNFGQFTQPIVVYASGTSGGLEALGCMPTPTAAEFESRLSSIVEPTGTGPPAVLLVGTVGANDLAILDSRGRTVARSQAGIGAGLAAQCAGTTLAAVASYENNATVRLVDLARLSVVEERPIEGGFASVTGDRIACFGAGDRIVIASGYGPNDGSVTVATSNEPGNGDSNGRRSFDGVSRAVIHPTGSVFLLPAASDVPFRVASSTDLADVTVEGVLPDGAAALDGDISPDGTRLAVLATFGDRAIEWNTGATHVITVALVDGMPVAGSASAVELAAAGENQDSPTGAAKWIRWVDDSIWIVEHETNSTKLIEFVSADGQQLLPPTDVQWGWGLVPLTNGVLRTRNGGVEIISRDGTSLVGDPAPWTSYVDRSLSVVALEDVPEFTPVPDAPGEPLAITPIADLVASTEPVVPVPSSSAVATSTESVPPQSTGEAPASVIAPPDEAAPQGEVKSTGSWAPLVGGLIVVLGAAGMVLLWQTRRRRPAPSGA